ncbi:MAG: class I SAM-dependent rRNA methyltransferase [Prevotella sp.]|nr:class I SAM-dependent rRNA methyltransferase [Prevotella sp.]
MSNYKRIFLRKGKEESLRRYHPWVFSGAVANVEKDIAEGDVVRVISSAGECLGTGHYQVGSIAVRMLSFAETEIDDAFWRARISQALSVRRALGIIRGGENTIFRLVHGEGDGLPGLVIDCYNRTAVVQAHSVGMHRSRQAVAAALVDVAGDIISNVYYKSFTTLPFKAGLGQEDMFLVGSTDDNTAVENGLRFRVDWLHGQKTGFFVDQRDNRALVERYSEGRRVLNMFCYTGGFSVYAMRGGAERVCSVDSSEKAIDLTNANIEMNFPGDTRHTAYAEDAFKFLANNKERYNLVVLDPPAFAKHRMALANALKGYIRLNARGLEAIDGGGVMFTFSCSQVVTKDQFRNAVFTAATLARRNVRILHQLHQPADHPINIYHPEGEYLKGLVLYVE